MKVIGNFIKGVIISVWALIAIFTTICLISYNKYSVSEIGDYTLLIIDNDELEPVFKENDIAIIKNIGESKYEVGDYAFYYLSNPFDAVFVNYGEITKIDRIDHAEDAYYFGDEKVSYTNMIGKANGAMVYHHYGKILAIFESRWGFMFLIILPTLYAVVYEIYAIVVEAKRDVRKELENENKE